jgi:Fe-S cluster assembly iron-binding protein IscA
LDELEDNSDQVYENDGFKILLDKRVSEYLETRSGITLNYVETRLGSGFVFEGASSC